MPLPGAQSFYPWKLACFVHFVLLTSAVASTLDVDDPGVFDQHRHKAGHVVTWDDIAPVAPSPSSPSLRLQMNQYLASSMGSYGQSFLSFMVSILILVRGSWLLLDSPQFCRLLTWFIVGSSLSFACVVYVSTQLETEVAVEDVVSAPMVPGLQFAVTISCHCGMVFALFPAAGCYILGASASILSIHMMHATAGFTVTAWLPWLEIALGILCGYWCSCFSKPALDFLSSMAGSGVMVLMLYWWMNDAFHWCLQMKDCDSATPLEYWFSLWFTHGSLWDSITRLAFSISWCGVWWLGRRLRKWLEVTEEERFHHWFQDQIRQAPNDCDRVPRWPGAPDLGPAFNGRDLEAQTVGAQNPRRQGDMEEDFGMYLLPEDLESMKRSKSIPCFTPKAKIVPVRQGSLPVEPASSASRPRRLTLPARP